MYVCIYFIEHYKHFCLLIFSSCRNDLMIFGGK